MQSFPQLRLERLTALIRRDQHDDDLWLPFLTAVATCIGLAVYLSFFVLRGWTAHDEGLLGQASERVLQGEVPHRDFHDMYTGGLAYLNALAFQVFGMELAATRWMLFGVCVLAFLPAIYWTAARTGSHLSASLAAVTCLSWSLPNYFTALPSWYILIFVMLGVVCLLRFAEGDRLWPLFAAGACGGAAVLMKITGLYYLAAAMLFLLFFEQEQSGRWAKSDERRSFATPCLTAVFSSILIYLVLRLLRSHLDLSALTFFVLPIATVCCFLVWNEWRFGNGSFRYRFTRLAFRGLIFWAGVAIPIGLFVLPYARHGELAALWNGVFVLPTQRLSQADWPLPPLIVGLLGALPLLLCRFGAAAKVSRKPENSSSSPRTRLIVLALVLGGLLVLAGNVAVRFAVFESLRWLLPWLTILACRRLATPPSDPTTRESLQRRHCIFLMATMASLCSLIQYPFSVHIYFYYCAPLVILALYFVVTQTSATAVKPALNLVLLFYAVFGFVHLNRGIIRTPEMAQQRVLEFPRSGGLTVTGMEADAYNDLYTLVQQCSAPGSAIFAAPDCPEVYFITERKNPTGDFFDFFNQHPLSTAEFQKLLDERRIEVVVINREPSFSQPMDPARVAAVAGRFPSRGKIGKFDVFWRSLQVTPPKDMAVPGS